MNCIAIIPARGGSKRIPGKNIKPFFGKPIIAYSIETAIQSNLFDKVIVSTDSEQIASVAKQYGAEIPFVRDEQLADDYTPLWEVIYDAIVNINSDNYELDYVCCILSTAPFIRIEDINKGFEIIRNRKVGSVFAVTTFPFPILRAQKIMANGHLEMFWPEYELTFSNDLPEAYHDAGQFYWLDVKKFLLDKKMYAADSMPVILPRNIVQDIDTPEDWKIAEDKFKLLSNTD